MKRTPAAVESIALVEATRQLRQQCRQTRNQSRVAVTQAKARRIIIKVFSKKS
jgi:hypothetical protein